MQRVIWIFPAMFILFLFPFVLGGCSVPEQEPESDKPLIIATSFVGYDFARTVAGDNAAVEMLLSPGEETHSFDPTPEDIIKVENCDIFIYGGGESDDWVREILSSTDNKVMNTVSMMECVELYEEEAKEGMMAEKGEHDHEEGDSEEHHDHEEDVSEEHHDHEEEVEYDEHVWTSVPNAMKIVAAVNIALQKADTDHQGEYQANTDAYLAKLLALDTDFRNVVNQGHRQLIVFGDRFPFLYFVREYGLDYYAAFPGCSSETEPNAATIAFLINKVKEENIPVIFKEELSNGNIATAIAEETGAKVKTFYVCHNISATDFAAGETYLSLMQKNLEHLEEALN